MGHFGCAVFHPDKGFSFKEGVELVLRIQALVLGFRELRGLLVFYQGGGGSVKLVNFCISPIGVLCLVPCIQ